MITLLMTQSLDKTYHDLSLPYALSMIYDDVLDISNYYLELTLVQTSFLVSYCKFKSKVDMAQYPSVCSKITVYYLYTSYHTIEPS